MDHFNYSTNLLNYINSLPVNEEFSNWIFKGKTDHAFGTPGGKWNENGFLFERSDKNYQFIVRSIPKTDDSYIVLESYNINGQLYNIKLKDNKKFIETDGLTKLLESYSMTVGMGKKKTQDVKNEFIKQGVETNIISEVIDESPNWQRVLIDLLNWAVIREKVKVELKKTEPVKERGRFGREEMNSHQSTNKMDLNQILYGPPGTGKTYKLLNEYYQYFEILDKTIDKREYEFNIIKELTWWQIIALVLLEHPQSSVPDIKKHRYIEYKLQVSNTTSLNQTVWGQLSAHTILESESVKYSKRAEPQIFEKSDKSIWSIVESEKELIDDLIEIEQNIKNYKDEQVMSKNHKFVTFHQSFSYEDFIEGIKPVMDDESAGDTSAVNYKIEKGVFYSSCNEAAKLAGFLSVKDSIDNYNSIQREEMFSNADPYCLFIDEINRGNISQIFGELITLIEDDKRLGKSEIILELPYSKDKFGVPPNLHIIGTMNTANRSVEALDTALRRRFSFKEMLPKSSLLSPSAMYCRLLWKYENTDWEDAEFKIPERNLFGFLGVPQEWEEHRKEIWEKMKSEKLYHNIEYFSHFKCSGINLEEILKKINNRVEILLDRDHTIGHSYFMKIRNEEDLILTFKDNIIPLLQEYFYNDYEKIGWIIGEGFFEEKRIDKKIIFSKFFKAQKPEFDFAYELADIKTLDINETMQKLLGIAKEDHQLEEIED